MLIGLCGGICAGKKTVARYLVEHHGFKRLYLDPTMENKQGNSPDIEDEAPTKKHQQQNIAKSISSRPAPPGRSRPPAMEEHTFPSADALLDFVTRRWRDRWVTTSIPDEGVLDLLARRPFFILISVDAPLTVRWRRFQERQRQQAFVVAQQDVTPGDGPAAAADDEGANADGEAPPSTLDEFVRRSDAHLYDPHTGLQPLINRATVRLLNTSSSLAHLYATLGKLRLADEERLRPGWDRYFMALASLAAQRSNCMKRRVGCVLVGREQRRVISTGYNGTPRGLRNCNDGGCGRCNAAAGSGVGLTTCLCLHAEENALLEAGRERIRDGAVLYCDTCPCLTCSIKICQVGITEVVYAQGYSMDRETAEVFREAGVKLRQFVPPPDGLIHLEKMELY